MASLLQRAFLFLLCGAAVQAESPLLSEARVAQAEFLPGVAISKLHTFLVRTDLPPAERGAATLLLGEAQAAAGQHEQALETIKSAVEEHLPAAVLLRGQIHFARGEFAEARAFCHAAAADPGVFDAATLGEAEALQALGRTEEAALLLEAAVHAGRAAPLVRIRWVGLLCDLRELREAETALAQFAAHTPEETRWRRYAEGRILLLQDQPAPALEIFKSLLEVREHLPESLQVAATFGLTDAKIALNGTENADDVLESFIWHNPGSTWLETAFRRLDQIYAQEENAPDVELQKWALRPQLRRSALAWFYLGKLQLRGHREEKAAFSFDHFLRTWPQHPLVVEVYGLQAELFASRAQFPETVRALEAALRLTTEPAQRAALELRVGLAHFQQGEFLLSATLFEEAARHSATLRPVATFDAALAWLHVRNAERFRAAFRAFNALQPASALRGELSLEEGLVQARSGDPQAAESLKSFVRDYPESPRQAEARLALAEVGLRAGAAPVEPEYLQAANPIPPAPEIADQSACLAIFLADARQPREDAKTIDLARRFLAERPTAAQLPEVRMKLGQIYFRQEDYANAETQFATLTEGAAGPFTEAALFLAGKCAMKLLNQGALDRALEFFDRVVKLEGPLRLYARQEQAIVQSRTEHEDQALALYEIILTSPEVDPELWQAALCGKGDNLVALGRRAASNPARLAEALAVFDQLAASPGTSANWRNQALYKKGKTLELLGRPEEALAAFFDVLNTSTTAAREYFWFYKAGFDAARTYEQQENWKSALGIYQKMVKTEGPRTAEAQARLRQVRLEHFLWE